MPSRFTRSPWRWSALIALPVVALVALALLVLPSSERGQASALPIIQLGAAQTGNNDDAPDALTDQTSVGTRQTTSAGPGAANGEDAQSQVGEQSSSPGQGATNGSTGHSGVTGDSSSPADGASPTTGGWTTTVYDSGSGSGSTSASETGSGAGSSTVVTSGIRVQQRGQADSGDQQMPSSGDTPGGANSTGTSSGPGKGH